MQNIVQHLDSIIAIIFAVLFLAEAIARVTPTEKDNSIIAKIQSFLDTWFPNRAKPKVNGIDETFESTSTRKRLRKDSE